MHTDDAQTAQGVPQPPPDEAAVDGVDEFLSTCVAGTHAFGRIPLDSLRLHGDRRLFDLLLAWDPEESDVLATRVPR